MLSTSHFFLLLLLSLVSILFPYTTLFRSPPRRYGWHRTRHRPRRRCRAPGAAPPRPCRPSRWWAAVRAPGRPSGAAAAGAGRGRSEERRVGKEGRAARWEEREEHEYARLGSMHV